MTMPTPTTGKSADTSASKAKTTAGPDAIALLKADHRAVEELFAQFEKATAKSRKGELAERICLELKVHMQIEEEIFYPAAREALKAKEEDMIDEGVVEHASAKELIAEIETMEPGEDLYDAKVHVLSEQIEHHVEEEEKEMFPKLQKTDMDMKALGARMAARKEELKTKLARSNGRPA
jgi:iron-sulfur cluster repair protein YtfE (RIC family)